MSHEHPKPADTLPPEEDLTFTKREELYNRVTDGRLRAFLDDTKTTIHRAEVSSNSYGGFLFLTISRERDQRRECITFYGLGYHEYRERWFTDEWFWYRGNVYPDLIEQRLSREEVEALIQERREAIQPDISTETQSRRGRLFEMLAELTDEGAPQGVDL
jgi:hypothetical protein